MKTTDAKEKKQLRELSDEELEKVTGGAGIDCSLPENKDKFQCRVKLMGQDATFHWGEISDPQSIASFGCD